MLTLYGIKNCDTVKKARAWLERNGIAYRFHDFRSDGLDAKLLQRWTDQLGWEALLNRRGTTWRNLPESTRATVDAVRAQKLMLEQPALIKRPVLDDGKVSSVGFREAEYQQRLQSDV